MPLVRHIRLPTFDELQAQGEEILSQELATHQDIREMHIGFLNMMPDAALTVTELQFLRLVGSCNQIAQFYVHPFSIPGLSRSVETQSYIDQFYVPFAKLQEEGLDALIITGANVSNPTLDQEAFWPHLQEVIGWAADNVTSILCSCLATHALLKHLYQIERQPLPRKRWGVFSHRIKDPKHPILRDINTRFDVPHSRHNAITREQLEAAGLHILVESHESDVHVAVSEDQCRFVYFQGHPEYHHNSLNKEYKREVNRFLAGEREDYPPHPDNYFSPEAAQIADNYELQARAALAAQQPPPPFPELELEQYLDNTWGDTGKSIFNNWLGLVYKLTHIERKKPFADGIDPRDPLGLNTAKHKP